MNQRLDTYEHWRMVKALNAMREEIATPQMIGTVRAAISNGGGSLNVQNELLRLDSTHTAVTWDAVEAGDRLRAQGDSADYVVTYVVNGWRSRMHQLYLRREEPPGSD